MQNSKIGQILGKLVPITDQDVEEILCQQAVTGQRFGEIAISWGLCNAEHVLRAWADQTANRHERVDLDYIGVDAQAIPALPRELAVYFRAIPIRILSDLLVVAVADESAVPTLREFLQHVRPELRFVLADKATVEAAVEAYYDSSVIAA
jgi:type IV pilus assembly protein PilB